MRGIVFELFEAFVVERRGEDAFEDLLDEVRGQLSTTEPYLGMLDYPSDDLAAMASAESRASGVPRETLLLALGEFCIPRLARRYAWAFAGQRSLAAFLAFLHRTAYGRSDLAISRLDGRIDVALSAPPTLCALGEGLLVGLASHFAETYAIECTSCVERGAERCAWELVET